MAHDVQGPERLLCIARIGFGKTTLIRALGAMRHRVVMIDWKCDSKYPGAAPELVTSDREAAWKAIKAPRPAGNRVDIVIHPLRRDGRGVITSTGDISHLMSGTIDAIEEAAERGGWITLVIEEMAAMTDRKVQAEVCSRLAVCRRGASTGQGGWSCIMSAQSAALIPPVLRRFFGAAYFGQLSVDDDAYMQGRWRMSGAKSLYERCSTLEQGQWLRVDMIKGAVTPFSL